LASLVQAAQRPLLQKPEGQSAPVVHVSAQPWPHAPPTQTQEPLRQKELLPHEVVPVQADPLLPVQTPPAHCKPVSQLAALAQPAQLPLSQ
jgi:hypothetical protein